MTNLISAENQLFKACFLVVAAVYLIQTAGPVAAQSNAGQTRIRWEKLLYEDAAAVIRETTAELAKNPANAIALRMRSSAHYRNIEPDKGKADAVAAFALL